MYGQYTRRQPADPVTQDEVLSAFTSSDRTYVDVVGHAVSIGVLALAIWHRRGGVGDQNDRHNADPTPRITEARLRPVLDELVRDGKIDFIHEDTNSGALVLVDGHPRRDATYYGLSKDIGDAVNKDNARKELVKEATVLAERLNGRAGLIKAQATNVGCVSVMLTMDQARTLFGLHS